MEKRLYYKVKPEDLPCSAEDVLRRRLGLTKSQIRSAKFRPEGICVNGNRSRVTCQLTAGDRIEVLLEMAQEGSIRVKSSPGTVEILYEDQDLLLVNKPAGMAAHPGHGHYGDSLANYLMYYFEQQGIYGYIRAIGRLDRDTSGIMVFARSRAAASRLWGGGHSENFGIWDAEAAEKSVEKEYQALVWGRMEKTYGIIELPIGRCHDHLNKMEVTDTGAFARTRYHVVEEYKDASLVSLRLDTGRTHQIRVHMAALGHPLVGDRLYGRESAGLKNKAESSETAANGLKKDLGRSALHCIRVRVRQPFTGEWLERTAPLPEDMRNFIINSSGRQ